MLMLTLALRGARLADASPSGWYIVGRPDVPLLRLLMLMLTLALRWAR